MNHKKRSSSRISKKGMWGKIKKKKKLRQSRFKRQTCFSSRPESWGDGEGEVVCVCRAFSLCVCVCVGNLMDSESLVSAACKTLMNNTGIYQLIVCCLSLLVALHTPSLPLSALDILHLMRNTCWSSSLGIPCSRPIRLLVPLLCTAA